MSQSTKLYKVLRKGKKIAALIPGRYAGNKTHKIFGRLDCKSGKHMHKENRVFFASWVDAIAEGYKPCRKCQPTHSDTYPEHQAVQEELLKKLHIGLWTSPPGPGKTLRVWHIRLNWQDKNAKKGAYREIKIQDCEVYRNARNAAIRLGAEYNLPVLHRGTKELIVIRAPTERTNDIEIARDKRKIKEFLKSKKVRYYYWMFLDVVK